MFVGYYEYTVVDECVMRTIDDFKIRKIVEKLIFYVKKIKFARRRIN